MLSPYSRNCLRYYRPRDYKKYKAKKLVASFGDRKKYVCHYRNLKFYLEQGMQLGRLHGAIKFRQRPWLKKFVLCNTRKRKLAKSKADSDHYKTNTNSTYGKLCQQDRYHSTCIFAQNEETARRCLKSPVYKHWRIIGNKCVVFLGQKKMVRFNKPFIDGFTVLDLSKLHIYTVYYNQIKQRAPTAQVVLTDTDSLLLHVPDMPKSALMRALKEGIDFSNYPTDHLMHSPHLKSIPGYMKDESAGKHVVEVRKMLPPPMMLMMMMMSTFFYRSALYEPSAMLFAPKTMLRIANARVSRNQLWHAISAWRCTKRHSQKLLQSGPRQLVLAHAAIKLISSGRGKLP
jgi:hypothetical protein